MTNRVDFDQYTDNYNQLLREETGFFSSSEEYFARYKVDIVRAEMNGEVGSILEYGCGIGRNIPFLQRAFPGARICGSDISKASLEIARRDNPDVEFFDETAEDSVPGQFDLIFVAGVFHHIPVDQRKLSAQKLYERLNRDGALFVFEHNPYNPITRRIVSNCPYDEDAVLLKPAGLAEVLVAGGMSVQRKSYCLFVPPSLSWLGKLEDKLGWLPLGGQYWVKAARNL